MRILGLATVATALGVGVPARAQLSADSPFLPPDNGAAAAATNPNTVEYRGLMSTPHGNQYLLYDPVKRTSLWLGLNEAGAPYLITSDDAEHERIVVRANGELLTLKLKDAKVAALPPGVNLGAIGGAPPANLGPVVLRPTPEDEQRRLQAVAEEVRRRRQARLEAEQQQNGGAAH